MLVHPAPEWKPLNKSISEIDEEAARFFARYRAEFDNANWPGFASLFHEPCLTVRGDGTVRYLNSRAEAAPFFKTVADAWRREGYFRFTTSNFDVVPIGRNGMLVTFDWEMLDKDDRLIRKWRQSYQLVRAGGSLQVLTSMFHADS
jgi:hypothetical protein